MKRPYASDPNNRGILYYTDEQVIDFCKKANRAGLQIEMHAIGDRAFDQAAHALKAALDDFPREDHRHGIIHACLPTEYGMQICRQYHIQLPMQIAFDNWRQEPQEYTLRLLGEERNARLNPVRSFTENGCFVSFGCFVSLGRLVSAGAVSRCLSASGRSLAVPPAKPSARIRRIKISFSAVFPLRISLCSLYFLMFWLRNALMKPSMSPSMTLLMLPFS